MQLCFLVKVITVSVRSSIYELIRRPSPAYAIVFLVITMPVDQIIHLRTQHEALIGM